MKTINPFILIAIIACSIATASAQPPKGTCQILFECTSTTHDFDGKVTATPFPVTYGDAGKTLNMEIDVSIADMDTDSAKRDKDMRKMFDAVKFPKIHGSVKEASMAAVQPAQNKDGAIAMALTISGVTKTVNATVSKWQEKQGTVEFDMSFPVLLSDFKLKAPRILFIKVGNVVRVTAHFKIPR